MKKSFSDFLNEKGISAEELGKKTADEQAALYNEFNDLKNSELEKAIEEKASKEDIEGLKAEISKNTAEQLKALNAVLKEQGLAIAKFAKKDEKEDRSFAASLKESLSTNIDNLKKLSSTKEGSFQMHVKAAGTMTSSNISGGNVPVEDRIPGLSTLASRRIRLLDVMSSRGIDGNLVSWVNQVNKDGTAGQTGEGLAKNQVDFDMTVTSEALKKTTAYIKVSTEMLSDISWLQTEINNELMRELLKAVESGAWDGDGTGNNLNGVYTQATAFSPTTAFTGTVDNANKIDVLIAAIDQIENADQVMENPVIFMHPSDVNFLSVEKVSATDKRYNERLVNVAGALQLDGIPIVKTTLVTADKYLVGDFSRAVLVAKDDLMIDVGLDADDFTKNLRTIIAEWRGLVYVKNNDRTAFVKGDFSTDQAVLETA